ncbi:hypothetical protein M3599_16235 [Niallia circulans]|uniref:hypothetical protein n=1 Tax=Niallia TaxID=2837506 RepID=UPI0011A93102|nr:hypothetical protein [Niallia circulans]MCM2982475.1 hypothetical protein [Niallia circulans]
MKQFKINIKKQYWLGSTDSEEDLCSHGEIYLKVNDTVITQSGIDEEWGISESALALLRTLDNDYLCAPEEDEGLILHGCGLILMTSCPISIHWTVKHCGDDVFLSDFVKFTSTDNQSGSIYYPDLKVKLSRNEYKFQVCQFAIEAREFFRSSKEKRISDDFDKNMYDEFWSEYNQLLNSNLPD